MQRSIAFCRPLRRPRIRMISFFIVSGHVIPYCGLCFVLMKLLSSSWYNAEMAPFFCGSLVATAWRNRIRSLRVTTGVYESNREIPEVECTSFSRTCNLQYIRVRFVSQDRRLSDRQLPCREHSCACRTSAMLQNTENRAKVVTSTRSVIVRRLDL